MHHGFGIADGHGGINRIAAGSENILADLGCQMLRRHHHGLFGRNRLVLRQRAAARTCGAGIDRLHDIAERKGRHQAQCQNE